VAEYIKNTMPPGALFTRTLVPAAPTGMIAMVDGSEAKMAIGYADQIQAFFRKQREPPKQVRGESNLDFVVRSNAWYSRVMNEYNKVYAAPAATLVDSLIKKNLLELQVAELARNPVNPLGIKALAIQIQVAGTKLATQETQ